MQKLLPCAAALATLAAASAAPATDVNLAGVVVNACIMSSTPGILGAETDGRTLSSQGSGGTAATLVVTATGGLPSLTFSAPTATTPAGFSGSATPAISYSSSGGILQPFTSALSSQTLNGLLETVTVQGRISSTNGFASGTYNVRTTVTCQQP